MERKVKKPKQETWRKRISCSILYKTIAIIIGLSTPIYSQAMSRQKTGGQVCNSAECMDTASRVLKYMDENKDPCENFYDFACGNYVADASIPNTNETESSSQLKYLVEEQFIDMIDKPIENDEPHSFQLVKKLYSACMNEERIQKEGLMTIKNILKKLGGWPVLEGDSWVEDNFNWKECDYSLKKLGYPSHFVTLKYYHFDSGKVGLFISSRQTLKRDPENLKNYLDYMVNVAELLGADRKTAESELKESLEFELELSNYNSSHSYYVSVIWELERMFPRTAWMDYINKLLSSDNEVTGNNKIIFDCPGYIAHFEAVMSKTPKRVQANYAMWKVIFDSAVYLTDDVRRWHYGPDYEQLLPRRKECLYECMERLNIASSAMYVNYYFNDPAKRTVIDIVSNIRSRFYVIITSTDWMDEENEQYAFKKAVAMEQRIGYPEELVDRDKLEEYHEDLKLDTDDYLLSVLNINALDRRRSYRKEERVDYIEWETYVPVYNYEAKYLLSNNLKLPAGSLQGIFFDIDRPAYMNYGAIGFLISREIAYGFGDVGNKFDMNGFYIMYSNWWSYETRLAYQNKAQCFINEFAKQQNNLEVDDSILARTIISDSGIKMAYLAYEKSRNGLERTLPGLNYTPKQMFWISAANTLCSKYRRPENQQWDYVPANYRVLAAFGDSEYFAKDFNCPAGSPMNPTEKCKFW